MSSSEDPVDGVQDPSAALALLQQRLKSSETLAKSVLARHRRSRENAGALSRLLTGAAAKMNEVEALLAEADQVVVAEKVVKVVKAKPKQKKKRLVEPNVEAMVDVSDDHQNREDPKVVQVEKKNKRKKVIPDATAGETSDGTLVFFSLALERVEKMWKCPAVDGNELQVVRSQLTCIDFADLLNDQRIWYLSRLEEEILRRFRVNFPVLFRSQGLEMTMARESLIQGSDSVNGLIDILASRVEALQVSSKQSPSLSAANNTALMISAKLHQQMSGQQDWYPEWLEQVRSLCQRCKLSFTTMERYRKAGELMLRCQVLTCLLPSFVQQLESPIEALLDTEESKNRLAAAFEEQMQEFDGGLRLNGRGNGGREIESPPVLPPPPLPVIEFPNTRGRPVRGKMCQRCSSNRIKCHSCKRLFCWKCDGYHEALPEPPLVYPGTDTPIKIYMFCKPHVDKYELINGAYLRYTKSVKGNPLTLPRWIQTAQVEEAAAMVQIFSADNRQFNVIPIAPDGWCIFGCVARATSTTLSRLILDLKRFVATTDLRDLIVQKYEHVMGLFRGLDLEDPDDDSIQKLWSGGGGDVLIAVLAKFLNSNGSFRIVDWMITDGRLQRGHLCYPDENQYDNTINVLLSNKVMPHYDLLVAK